MAFGTLAQLWIFLGLSTILEGYINNTIRALFEFSESVRVSELSLDDDIIELFSEMSRRVLCSNLISSRLPLFSMVLSVFDIYNINKI
jgi:hypothetical protein